MAADIFISSWDKVPVGEDQKQHLRITRDIAARFNYHWTQLIEVARATYSRLKVRASLTDGTRKMSVLNLRR